MTTSSTYSPTKHRLCAQAGYAILPALVLVAILGFVAVGIGYALPAQMEGALTASVGGVLAQESGGLTPKAPSPTAPSSAASEASAAKTAEANAQKKICEAKKTAAASAGRGESPTLTQSFRNENVIEENHCVGAVIDTSKPNPNPKDPNSYKCVGETTQVSLTSGGAGTILSRPQNTVPAGTCQTRFCDSSNPPVCGEAKQFAGGQGIQSWATSPIALGDMPSGARAEILALGPLDETQQRAMSNAFESDIGQQEKRVQAAEANLTSMQSSCAEDMMFRISECEPAQRNIQTQRDKLASLKTQLQSLAKNNVVSLVSGERPTISSGAATEIYGPPLPTGQNTFAPSGSDQVAANTDPTVVNDVSGIPPSHSTINTAIDGRSLANLQEEYGKFARLSGYERVDGLVIGKDGKTTHVFGTSGTGGEASADMSGVIEAMGEDKDAQGYIIHNHPLATIMPDPAERAAVIRGDQPYPTMPPSMTDIHAADAINEDYTNPNITWQVADPSGIWSYKVDSKSQEWIDYQKDIHEADRASGGLVHDDREDARQGGYEPIKRNHQDLFTYAGSDGRFPPYYYNNPENRQALIDAYRRIGVTITYEPHPR